MKKAFGKKSKRLFQVVEKPSAASYFIQLIYYNIISKSAFNMSVDWCSRHFAFRGRAMEPPPRFAPAGSPLPRTPAGIFVPSAPINRVFSIKTSSSTNKLSK
jgi:hypothetical protein